MLQVRGCKYAPVIKYETKHDFDFNLPYLYDAVPFFKEHRRGGEVKSTEGVRYKKTLMYIALLDT